MFDLITGCCLLIGNGIVYRELRWGIEKGEGVSRKAGLLDQN